MISNNFLTWVTSFEASARSPTPTQDSASLWAFLAREVACEDPLTSIPEVLKPERSGMTAVFPDKMDESF